MKTRNELGSFLNESGLVGEGVELGVLNGEFSTVILNQWQGATLYLVDPLATQPPTEYIDGSNRSDFNEARRLVGLVCAFDTRAIWLPWYSDQAAPTFAGGQLDFVYIDANHSFKHVNNDLKMWYSKVKSGGLIAGHDYYDRYQTHPDGSPVFICGVKSAVDGWIKETGLKLNLTEEENQTWWVRKP